MGDKFCEPPGAPIRYQGEGHQTTPQTSERISIIVMREKTFQKDTTKQVSA